MTWRLAPTLVVCRDEINKRYPIRDKTSDGSLGNTSHAAGTSDHNPDSRGVVCAIDVDEDVNRRATDYPSFHAGQPLNELLGELLALAKAGRLPQLRYIIYEGYIYSSTYGFRKQKYEGANPHDHHMHISVSHAPVLADSKKTWFIYPEEDDMPTAKEIATELSTNKTFLNAVADAVADRDGNVPNDKQQFTPNTENDAVSIATALGVLGERTKPKV